MAPDAGPIKVGTDTQFFLDGLFVDQNDGVALKANPARKAGVALGPE